MVSIVLDDLQSFGSGLGGLALHGAHIAVNQTLRDLAKSGVVETYEAFVPARQLSDPRRIQSISEGLFPEGQGQLRAFPIHALPLIWSDGQPRVLWTPDLWGMVRDRFLRDKFARGPLPHFVDSHAVGSIEDAQIWSRLSTADSVPGDTVLANSHATRDYVTATFEGIGFPCPYRLEVLHHGVDTEVFTPPSTEEKAKLRREFGWPADAPIALFQARLTPAGKADLAPLVRAFARHAPDDALLVLCGQEGYPGYVDHLRAVANDLGVAHRIRFTGKISEKERHLTYRAADVFVFPTNHIETQGLSVAEAMACGLPVVASSWGGVRDMVVDGVTGTLVPTRLFPGTQRIEDFSVVTDFALQLLLLGQCIVVDEAVLGEALGRLLRDPMLRQRQGAAGRAVALERLTTSGRVESLRRLFTEALATAAAPSAEPDQVDRIGMPVRYGPVLAAFGNASEAQSLTYQTTEDGERFLAGQSRVRFYDDVAPLVNGPMMVALLQKAKPGTDWAGLFTVEPREDDDRTAFHIALLVKHGLLTAG